MYKKKPTKEGYKTYTQVIFIVQDYGHGLLSNIQLSNIGLSLKKKKKSQQKSKSIVSREEINSQRDAASVDDSEFYCHPSSRANYANMC